MFLSVYCSTYRTSPITTNNRTMMVTDAIPSFRSSSDTFPPNI